MVAVSVCFALTGRCNVLYRLVLVGVGLQVRKREGVLGAMLQGS